MVSILCSSCNLRSDIRSVTINEMHNNIIQGNQGKERGLLPEAPVAKIVKRVRLKKV